MKHNWDKLAKQWENNQAVLQFSELAFSQLQQAVDLSGKKVLDFGCGTGLLSSKMSPIAKDIVALDGSEAMIEQLDNKALLNVEPVVDHLSRGLIAQHPAFRGQFDCIVASSVCGYLGHFQYQHAADLVYELLEPQGMFVQWDWVGSNLTDGLTEHKINQVLSKAKFSQIEVSRPFSIDTEQGKLPVIMGVAIK